MASEVFIVNKSAVLEAATKCPESKATLKTLFPEAFKPVWKKVPVFMDIEKEGIRCIERSCKPDSDIWISDEFILIPMESHFSDRGMYYRLERVEN